MVAEPGEACKRRAAGNGALPAAARPQYRTLKASVSVVGRLGEAA